MREIYYICQILDTLIECGRPEDSGTHINSEDYAYGRTLRADGSNSGRGGV